MRGLRSALALGFGRPTRLRRGVTLPELLVVLGIIGLALGLAVPAFRGPRQRHTLRQEVREVQHMLDELARQRAITTRRIVAVEFDLQAYPTPDRVRILDDVEWNGGAGRWLGDALRGTSAHTVEAPLDIQRVGVGATDYFNGLHAVVFSPTGACGVDDASETGAVELDILRMDTLAGLPVSGPARL